MTLPYSRSDVVKKICLALDIEEAGRAIQIAKTLKDHVGVFKIGLELFTSAGPSIVEAIADIGVPIFLDLKLHDIPNTVGKTARVLTRLGVSMFNVHASGGGEMIHAAVAAANEEAAKSGTKAPLVLAVTILTSIDQRALREQLMISSSVADAVLHFALMAKEQGAGGVVASPREIEIVRAACPNDFCIVTPGVRPAGADMGDQKRITTPSEAIKKGCDYVVIGRPILAAAEPVEAADSIIKEVMNAA